MKGDQDGKKILVHHWDQNLLLEKSKTRSSLEGGTMGLGGDSSLTFLGVRRDEI